MCRCPVLLELGIGLGINQNFSIATRISFAACPENVLINWTIQEIQSEQSFTNHPSPYHDVWRTMLLFLGIMCVLLGPEHNVH